MKQYVITIQTVLTVTFLGYIPYSYLFLFLPILYNSITSTVSFQQGLLCPITQELETGSAGASNYEAHKIKEQTFYMPQVN